MTRSACLLLPVALAGLLLLGGCRSFQSIPIDRERVVSDLIGREVRVTAGDQVLVLRVESAYLPPDGRLEGAFLEGTSRIAISRKALREAPAWERATLREKIRWYQHLQPLWQPIWIDGEVRRVDLPEVTELEVSSFSLAETTLAVVFHPPSLVVGGVLYLVTAPFRAFRSDESAGTAPAA